MKIEQVYELMSRFDSSNIHSIDLTIDEARIRLKKAPVAAQMVVAPAAISQAVEAQPTSISADKPVAMPTYEEADLLTSPVVGVFYAAPSPEVPAFVQVGSRVKKGDVIGLIEAMKMFNDITAPRDGIIEKVFVENETLVEFGTPLFVLKEIVHV